MGVGVSPTPWPPLPRRKVQYPFYRRLGGPQGRSGRAENLVSTGILSRTVQPVVSRYTDWANIGGTTHYYDYFTKQPNHLAVWCELSSSTPPLVKFTKPWTQWWFTSRCRHNFLLRVFKVPPSNCFFFPSKYCTHSNGNHTNYRNYPNV